MNQFWVRLSIAFSLVMMLTVLFIFTVYFALSWIGEPIFDSATYAHDYQDVTAPYVEAYIVEGKSDAEIVALLNNTAQLQTLLSEKRAEGFADGVSLEDLSFGRIAADYLYELISPDLLATVIIGALFGIVASIFISRQMMRPLSALTDASRALGQNDLSRRVSVTGSDEINELTATFNTMAAQLEHKEEVRQSMLADVSHELRTPLSGLEGTLRATLDGVFELDNRHISNLYQQTRHLSNLVDDLHLLARAEAERLTLNKTTVDLKALLQEVADVFSLLASEAGISFQTTIESASTAQVDPGRMRQVLSNLLNNALRYTPQGGTITLSLSQKNHQTVIRVQDSGTGIAADHLSHIFDRFYRADESRSRDTGGTGLGLAITKALVEAHEGTIEVDSQGLGHGSTFSIRLAL